MQSNPRVFMIGWEYPPHNSGGLGVACQGLTQALSSDNRLYFTLPYQFTQPLGHMELITCTDPSWDDPTVPPFLAYNPQKKASTQSELTAHELATLPQSDMEYKVDQYAQLVVNQAKKRAPQIDIVHAHDWMSFPAAIQVKDALKKPVVAHIHSTEYDRIPNGQGSHYIMQTEYNGMMLADHIIAVSNFTKKLLVTKYAIPASKITVVHNGMDRARSVDPGRHHFAAKRPVIVFMGRITSQKGPFHFLELATKVTTKIPNALFIMAGNGDLYHELLFRTAHQGLSASLLFSGFIRHKQRSKLLDRADVFVMPSLSEPFGLVALEAAERHTPVITSKTSGVNEVLPSAIQVDFWDTDRMSQVITELLDNRNAIEDQIGRQLQELDSISWKSSAQKINELYRRVFTGS